MKTHLLTASLLCISSLGLAQEDASYYLTPTKSSWTEGYPYATSTTNFNTSDTWDNVIPGDKIEKITFEYSNYHDEMRGLTVKYLLDDTAHDVDGSNGGSDHDITLAPNEYIIDGWIESGKNSSGNRRVCRINIKTNLNRDITYGPSCSSKVRTDFDIPDGQALIGFWGQEDKAIESAGIVYAEPLKLQLQDIAYGTPTEGVNLAIFVGLKTHVNGTTLTQPEEFRYNYFETVGSTDTWTETNGLTSSMGVEVSAAAKAIAYEASTTLSWGFTESYAETVGSSTSNATTNSMTAVATLNTASKTISALKMNFYYLKGSIPYTVTYLNEWDNEEFYVYGEMDDTNVAYTFVQTLDIGYVDDSGNAIIYDQYYDEWSEHLPPFAQPEMAGMSLSSTSLLSSISDINFNDEEATSSDNPSIDDPNWVMSAEEAAFRASHGL